MQFHQFSAEAFGLKSPEIDAELIIMSSRIWKNLGIYEDLRLEINNLGNETTRNMFSDALVQFLKKNKDKLDVLKAERERKIQESMELLKEQEREMVKGGSVFDARAREEQQEASNRGGEEETGEGFRWTFRYLLRVESS